MRPEDEPCALRDEGEVQRRLGLLGADHMAPLCAYLEAMRRDEIGREIPHFDPCDGGVWARALWLLEAPGPETLGRAFVSRNNPDGTSRNLCELFQQADLARRDTLLWHIVPWFIGVEKRPQPVGGRELESALEHLGELLSLLPRLEIVVLVGRKTQLARPQLRELTALPLVETFHPSSQVFNVWPEKKRETQRKWREVAAMLK